MTNRAYRLLVRMGVAAILLFLALPVFVIVGISFGSSRLITFPPLSYSLRWYSALFSEKQWLDALLQSIEISLLTTVFSFIIGLLGALAIYDVRPRTRLSNTVFALLTMPLFVPEIVLAIGLSRTTELLGFANVVSVALSISVITVPLVLISILIAMQGVDPRLKPAAASLGANKIVTFFIITVPLIRRGLLVGAFIAFLTAFDNLVISLFVASPEVQTLPIKFWSALRFYASPMVAPVSTIMLLLMVTVLSFTFLHGAQNDNPRTQDR